jgi:uncharacterized membrane protein YfcA
MPTDIAIGIGSAVIGLLVGLTGMGGGALMTPMLVLLFGISPSAAISSDLVAALFMKPAGVVMHWRRETIQWPIVRLLCYGSVPSAFAGTYAMHLLSNSKSSELALQRILGAALIIGALSIIARSFFNKTQAVGLLGPSRPVATVLIGVFGGFMVGLTSVGAGSLILVLLLTIYPQLKNQQLVGTDLTQALPLTFAATLGTLIFGHVTWAVTLPIILGSVPAVLIGSWFSSKEISNHLRPIIFAVVLLSGLKYVGLPIPALGVAALVAIGAAGFLVLRSSKKNGARSMANENLSTT